MKRNILFLLLILFGLIPEGFSQEYVLDLSGTWQFAMDSKDVGEQECCIETSNEDINL